MVNLTVSATTSEFRVISFIPGSSQGVNQRFSIQRKVREDPDQDEYYTYVYGEYSL